MARVFGTHEDDSMPIGLQKRGSTYWLRRRVPQDLVSAYGKAEIVKSLKTKDRAEAKRRLIEELYALERTFEVLRSDKGASEQTVSRAVEPETGTRLDRLRGGREASPSLFSVILDGSDKIDAELRRRGRIPSPPPTVPAGARKTTSWAQLTERWAAERKPIPKTRRAHQTLADEFAAILDGAGVEETTRAHVLRYKDWLVEKGVKAANLRTKLSRLKTLANYAYANDLLPTKIADGIRIPLPTKKARLPFDDRALEKLFLGPVHKDGARPTQGRGDAAYWLPLIAVFTGARLEEIAGLLVEDLIELTYQDADGVERQWWFFKFRPDRDRNRRLKNDDSERFVPVHPELLRLGLIRYAKTQRDEGQTDLFPRLTAHVSGKRAHKWGQWFGSYLRKECGVDEKRMVYHSFRHSLKDAARESEVPEELQRAIMGHAAEGVAGGYGLGFSRRRIVEGMAQIKVPGLPSLAPQF